MLNHNDGHAQKLQDPIQPNIGLDGEARAAVVEILNIILADEAVMAMKTRNAHWHVRGPGFFDLHTLFDQQFHQLNKMSGEIAERVRILGGFAICSFTEFLNLTRLEETPGMAPDLISILSDHEASIRFLREDARKCLNVYEDHGTYALFVRFICLHEEMAWVIRSYVEPELIRDANGGGRIQSVLPPKSSSRSEPDHR